MPGRAQPSWHLIGMEKRGHALLDPSRTKPVLQVMERFAYNLPEVQFSKWFLCLVGTGGLLRSCCTVTGVLDLDGASFVVTKISPCELKTRGIDRNMPSSRTTFFQLNLSQHKVTVQCSQLQTKKKT